MIVPGTLSKAGAVRALLSGMFLHLALASGVALTVTLTQPAPLESLSPQGDVTSVREAAAGARFTFVNYAAGQLTLRDTGGLYRIAASATDYIPSPAAPAPAPPTVQIAAAPASPPASLKAASPPGAAAGLGSVLGSPSPPALAPPSDDSSGPWATPDKVATVNAGLGKPLFGDRSFWKEPALMIAQRLGLGLEGRTKWETSYRRYFSGDVSDPRSALLGGGAYCIALYADAEDHPTSLLIAFANDGDYKNVAYVSSDIYRIDHPVQNAYRYFPGKSRDELSKEYDDDVNSFEPARAAEAEKLAANLSTLFGDVQDVSFGSDAVTRENMQRWDWNGVSFLLTSHENKYNLLRIVPTALADANGRTERIPRDEISAKLSGAVEHRPNGDIIITQIPMADQGPKGYCVPATWERVLRYTGVPGDMYTLSRIGNSQFGGGTWGSSIAQQLDDTLHDYGRHTEFLTMDIIDSISLRAYIDNGIPIFWLVNPLGYAPSLQRYSLADRDKDWDQWKSLLDASKTEEDKEQDSPLGDNTGHQVLIIGYNPQTREIAWSDAWGRDTRERWMTMGEAQHCTLGQYYIITW